MVIAEVFVPVYVWPAVRYTGVVFSFPHGAGSKLSETLGHLDLLASRGVVGEDDSDPVTRYSLR